MEEKVEKINEILSQLDENTQLEVIAECASKVGTTEWQEAVKELIKRIENPKKEKSH